MSLLSLGDDEIAERWSTFHRVGIGRTQPGGYSRKLRDESRSHHAIVAEFAEIAATNSGKAAWLSVLSMIDMAHKRKLNRHDILFRQIYTQLGQEYWEDTLERFKLT